MDFLLNLFIITADQLMLFVINLMVARHAGEVLFGDFTVATNALFLIATLLTLGIDSIIAYYVPKLYVKQLYPEIFGLTLGMKAFLRPIYTRVFVGGILLTVTLLALTQVIDRLRLFEIAHPLFLFIWGSVPLAIYNIFIQFFRAIDYMRTAVIMSLLQTSCYFLLSLAIYFYIYPVLFHEQKEYFPHVMLVGFITSYILMVILAIAINRRSKLRAAAIKKANPRYVWKDKIYGYTIQNLNKYIFTAIPLMIIELLGHSEHSVGLFSAVNSIISLAFVAIAPIGILIAPDISAAFAQNKAVLKAVMRKYLLICLAISLLIVVVMGFFAKSILILYQSNFIDALPYTYACLINVVTFSISMPLSKMIQYSSRGSVIGAKLTINLILIQLISSIILIHWFDLLGAVLCYIGINIIYNGIMIYMAIKIYRYDPIGHSILR